MQWLAVVVQPCTTPLLRFCLIDFNSTWGYMGHVQKILEPHPQSSSIFPLLLQVIDDWISPVTSGTTMSLDAAWEQQELPSGPGCAFTPAKPILGPDRVTLQVGIGSRLRSQYHVQYLYVSVLMLQTKANVVKFNKDWFLAVQNPSKSLLLPI